MGIVLLLSRPGRQFGDRISCHAPVAKPLCPSNFAAWVRISSHRIWPSLFDPTTQTDPLPDARPAHRYGPPHFARKRRVASTDRGTEDHQSRAAANLLRVGAGMAHLPAVPIRGSLAGSPSDVPVPRPRGRRFGFMSA